MSEQQLSRRNPPWTRDELILALDLYLQNPISPPGKKSPEVLELSDTLGRLGAALGLAADDRFRNPNGAYMKLMNFRAHDPAFIAQGMKGLPRGNRDEAAVWDEFAGNPALLRETAGAIRSALAHGSSTEALTSRPDDYMTEAPEGQLLTRIHVARERNSALAREKKAEALKVHGRLECEVCQFVFADRYGARGTGYIEVHHTRPLAEMKPGEKTKRKDLALLCANCHRMIHSRRPWLTIGELRAALIFSRSPPIKIAPCETG